MGKGDYFPYPYKKCKKSMYMKKSLYLIATAAIFAACSNEEIKIDQPAEGPEIGFDTFADVATRAENSSATNKNALSTYHTTFDVWGYKNGVAAGDGVDVFVKVPVSYASSAWSYGDTKRYWDKSASGYDFYAAAPAADAWTFDKTTRKLSYDNYSLTGATIDASATINNAAVFSTDVDLMISTDVNGYNKYTSDKVGLVFNHILSRFNIGVKKDASVTEVVKLKSIKVYNMKSNGKFNEASASGDALSAGTVARWGAASAGATTFTSGVGYATETTITADVNYVYQALCIPQAVGEEKVNLNGKASAAVGTEGQDGYVAAVNAVSTTSKPYIEIEYTLNDEPFKYYYNLADVFNGAATTDVNFCEGWQNNLTITIKPAAIEFDAEVYEWVTKNTGSTTVQ